ncbi:hypothetical protein [Formosa sp. PL04]|uniref:hypothetical protein n=1 Tax=Formosa sp. PL04 TaxID=3081755 RepID=UPI002981431C|nr:hypothetical protein [Formosa sp. PL04]MDW5290604.1 hypothetical protein [Formosa sp. PL04]
MTFLISLYPIIAFSNLEINQSLENIIKLASKQTKIYLVIGFLFAVSLIFLKRNRDLTIALLLITLISFVTISYIPRPFFLIGAFLPTLIHVYIFTFLFILFGALKAKSNYGYYLGILLLLVPLIICYIPFNYTNYKPSKGALEHINTMNMMGIITFIAKVFNNFQDKTFLTLSEIGLRIQIFISFAYTYHYLNWFSKTSIIGWKKAVSKKGALIILLIWTASIGLYLYDFKTGLIALYLLSFLHVLLEFPLNVTTIKEVLVLTKRNNLKLKRIIR